MCHMREREVERVRGYVIGVQYQGSERQKPHGKQNSNITTYFS